jgi:hypothetical protein
VCSLGEVFPGITHLVRFPSTSGRAEPIKSSPITIFVCIPRLKIHLVVFPQGIASSSFTLLMDLQLRLPSITVRW